MNQTMTTPTQTNEVVGRVVSPVLVDVMDMDFQNVISSVTNDTSTIVSLPRVQTTLPVHVENTLTARNLNLRPVGSIADGFGIDGKPMGLAVGGGVRANGFGALVTKPNLLTFNAPLSLVDAHPGQAGVTMLLALRSGTSAFMTSAFSLSSHLEDGVLVQTQESGGFSVGASFGIGFQNEFSINSSFLRHDATIAYNAGLVNIDIRSF